VDARFSVLNEGRDDDPENDPDLPVGKQVAWFGPVISRVPRDDEAARLWHGTLMVAGVDGFHEIKGRPPAPPVDWSAAPNQRLPTAWLSASTSSVSIFSPSTNAAGTDLTPEDLAALVASRTQASRSPLSRTA
jgi:hypothetical protein